MKLTYLGHIDGCDVKAITAEAIGSLVVITGNQKLISKSLPNHEVAETLGKKILKLGLDSVELEPHPDGFVVLIEQLITKW